uniref:Phosphatidic acid phosphatase type 2/haloperoxidase domain-containing protein n=1 Tax=Meloidogyne enterolobii TaxID=390850 RepID=A0A6V7U8V3_MELEN|nr:unnamed protein product [Meloidogyne enterolobii]
MENQREIQPDVSIECGEFNNRTTTTSTFLTRIASFLGLKPKAKLPIKRVLINFALIFIFGALIEAFLHILGPFTRGFFCDDNSIRLPYKTGTIPLWMLILYCLLVTNLTFIIGEYWRLVDHRTASEHLVIYEHGESFRVRLLIRLVFFQGFFCVAILATLIFTSLAKFSVGRLRPHFLAICDPLINGKEKEAHFCSLPENQHFYVENYTCGNTSNSSLIFEGRLSFFSGHSSLSMCAAVFTALYLHCRLKPLINYVVVIPLLQICVLSTAMFIAYTRIRDNLHHWSDIFVGMATGSSVATFVGLTIVGFKLNTHTFEESISLKEGRRNVPSG